MKLTVVKRVGLLLLAAILGSVLIFALFKARQPSRDPQPSQSAPKYVFDEIAPLTEGFDDIRAWTGLTSRAALEDALRANLLADGSIIHEVSFDLTGVDPAAPGDYELEASFRVHRNALRLYLDHPEYRVELVPLDELEADACTEDATITARFPCAVLDTDDTLTALGEGKPVLGVVTNESPTDYPLDPPAGNSPEQPPENPPAEPAEPVEPGEYGELPPPPPSELGTQPEVSGGSSGGNTSSSGSSSSGGNTSSSGSSGAVHTHSFTGGTCLERAVCSCGEQGDYGPHNWVETTIQHEETGHYQDRVVGTERVEVGVDQNGDPIFENQQVIESVWVTDIPAWEETGTVCSLCGARQ